MFGKINNVYLKVLQIGKTFVNQPLQEFRNKYPFSHVFIRSMMDSGQILE